MYMLMYTNLTGTAYLTILQDLGGLIDLTACYS